MKSIPLTDMEIEILVDALRSQARSGHLNDYMADNASYLLINLCKMLNE